MLQTQTTSRIIVSCAAKMCITAASVRCCPRCVVDAPVPSDTEAAETRELRCAVLMEEREELVGEMARLDCDVVDSRRQLDRLQAQQMSVHQQIDQLNVACVVQISAELSSSNTCLCRLSLSTAFYFILHTFLHPINIFFSQSTDTL